MLVEWVGKYVIFMCYRFEKMEKIDVELMWHWIDWFSDVGYSLLREKKPKILPIWYLKLICMIGHSILKFSQSFLLYLDIKVIMINYLKCNILLQNKFIINQ